MKYLFIGFNDLPTDSVDARANLHRLIDIA